MLLVFIVVLVQQLNIGNEPPDPTSTIAQAEVPLPPPVAPKEGEGTPKPALKPALRPQAIPPRPLSVQAQLDLEHRAWLQTLGDLSLLLPAFFAFVWLLLRWLTWKTVLDRRKGDPDDPLTGITLADPIDQLLDAPALRDSLKRLHSPVFRVTRRIDADATVERSARHAGLFHAVRRRRREVPDLLVLIEQRHRGDQMTGLATQLVRRLREAGLSVQRYDYRDSPQRLVGIWHTESTTGLAAALKTVLQDGGFEVHIEPTPLTLPVDAKAQPSSYNKVQWGHPDDVAMANHIEQRLAYLTWGGAPEVTNKLHALAAILGLAQPPGSNELRVLLLTPGTTGSRFRDRLAGEALTEEQLAEFAARPDSKREPELQATIAALIVAKDPVEAARLAKTLAGQEADAAGVEQAVSELSDRLLAVDAVGLQAALANALVAVTGRLTEASSDQAIARYTQALTDSKDPARQQRIRQLLGTLRSTRWFRDPMKDGGDGPAMIPIPGGSFMMGSSKDDPGRYYDEGPQHRVTVQPFAISRTEVSFDDFDRFAEATGRKKSRDSGWGRGDRPVIYVSWGDAQAYADWLSGQTGKGYRLPTEAEWEYAARGGTTTPFWTGACIHTDQANYDGNLDYNDCGAKTGVYREKTVAVGSLPPNPFGLHEVAGNVWEWVGDCRHDDYKNAPTDGAPWLETDGGECARRVLRGGGWSDNPRLLRSAVRDGSPAGYAYDDVGIRLARPL